MRLIKHIQKLNNGGEVSWEKLDKNQKRSYIMNFYINKGLSPIAAAAIVGNIEAESSFNPSILGDQGSALGLFQHRLTRREQLEKGYSNPRSVDAQLDFAYKELMGKIGNGWRDSFLQSNDLYSATDLFTTKFERPNEKYAHRDKRKAAAVEAMKAYDPTFKVSLSNNSGSSGVNTPRSFGSADYNVDISRLSYADIVTAFKDDPARMEEFIKLREEYEASKQQEVEERSMAEVQKLQMLKEEENKRSFLQDILVPKSNATSTYNQTLASSPPPQLQSFRFSSDWFKKMQEGGQVDSNEFRFRTDWYNTQQRLDQQTSHNYQDSLRITDLPQTIDIPIEGLSRLPQQVLSTPIENPRRIDEGSSEYARAIYDIATNLVDNPFEMSTDVLVENNTQPINTTTNLNRTTRKTYSIKTSPTSEYEDPVSEEVEFSDDFLDEEMPLLVLDRFTRVSPNTNYMKKIKNIRTLQEDLGLTPDGVIGDETVKKYLEIIGSDSFFKDDEDYQKVKRGREAYEESIRNNKTTSFAPNKDWYKGIAENGNICAGGVCHFINESTGSDIRSSFKDGDTYELDGKEYVFGDNKNRDEYFLKKVAVSNSTFEKNAKNLGYRQINYYNNNKANIENIIKNRKSSIDLEKFKKENKEYYDELRRLGVTDDQLVSEYASQLEDYIVTSDNGEGIDMKFTADKGNMYEPRIGDYIMYRSKEGGRHAKIITDKKESNGEVLYEVSDNDGSSEERRISEMSLKELQRLMSGESYLDGETKYTHVAVFTKDIFDGVSESEVLDRDKQVERAKKELQDSFNLEEDKKFVNKSYNLKYTGREEVHEDYNDYLSYFNNIDKKFLEDYSDIDEHDFENLVKIAAAIPAPESEFGTNLIHKGSAILSKMFSDVLGNRSTGIARIRVNNDVMTEAQKQRHFNNNDNPEVAAFKKKHKIGTNERIPDRLLAKFIASSAKVSASIALDRLVDQYRRLKNSPNLYGHSGSIFWQRLALSHNTPNIKDAKEFFTTPKEEGTTDSQRIAYANKVLEVARNIQTAN